MPMHIGIPQDKLTHIFSGHAKRHLHGLNILLDADMHRHDFLKLMLSLIAIGIISESHRTFTPDRSAPYQFQTCQAYTCKWDAETSSA